MGSRNADRRGARDISGGSGRAGEAGDSQQLNRPVSVSSPVPGRIVPGTDVSYGEEGVVIDGNLIASSPSAWKVGRRLGRRAKIDETIA